MMLFHFGACTSRVCKRLLLFKFLLSLVLNLSFASLFVHSGRFKSRTNQGIITSQPMLKN